MSPNNNNISAAERLHINDLSSVEALHIKLLAKESSNCCYVYLF